MLFTEIIGVSIPRFTQVFLQEVYCKIVHFYEHLFFAYILWKYEICEN